MVKKKLNNRQKKAIATRKRIYKVAIRLFQKNGYEKVTVSDICRGARVSTGTFYLYFKSKDVIIYDFMNSVTLSFKNYVEKELAAYKTIVDKIAALGRHIILYMKDFGPDQYRIIFRTQTNIDYDVIPVMFDRAPHINTMKNLIKEGQNTGEIRNDLTCDDIAHLMYICGRGLLYEWCVIKKGQLDLTTETDKLIKFVIEGIRT